MTVPPKTIDTPQTVDTPLGPVAVVARACPACGAANEDAPASAYSRPPWTLKSCTDCGFVYLDAAPDYAALAETLAWERSSKVEETRRAAAQPVGARLSKATRFRLHLLPRQTAHDRLVILPVADIRMRGDDRRR